jgi:hypothetical protein
MLRTGLEADTRCTSALWLWQAIIHQEHHMAQAALIGVNCSTHPLPHYTPTRKCQSENITTFGINVALLRTVTLPYVKAKAFSSKKMYTTIWFRIFILLYSSELLRNNLWNKGCCTSIVWFLTFSFWLDFKDQRLNSGKWRKLKNVRYFRSVVLVGSG